MDFDHLVTRFQQLLKPNKRQKTNDNNNHNNNNNAFSELVPWNWVCSSLVTVLENYASGVTEAIILSELQEEVCLFSFSGNQSCLQWDNTPKDWNDSVETKMTGLGAIGNTQTVGMLEVKVVSVRCLPDTHVWLVTLQDSSGTTMDHCLHPQLSELVLGPCPLLIPGRGLRIVGTRKSQIGNPSLPVLLSTPLLGVMLGSVPGVFEDHLTDPFENTSLFQLHQFRGTNGECTVIAKVMGVRGNSIYLVDTNNNDNPNNTTVILEIPPSHRQVIQLVNKGEVIRISPSIPFSFDPSHPTIQFIPGTLICILSSSTSSNSLDGMEITPSNGIKDMRYTKTSMKMNDIGHSMSGINVVARITKMLRNHPTSDSFPRYPVQLSDVLPLSSAGSQACAVDVTVWDTAQQLRGLRQGMIVYAENLFATIPKDAHAQATKYNVIASREYNTRLRAISTLPAILTSSLFPLSLLATPYSLSLSPQPYNQLPTNFIVRATILDYKTLGPEPPVYTAHARCLRIAYLADERARTWECRWCGMKAHEKERGEWEKIFNLLWQIGDGSAECWVYASARVHEVILQMRASAFAEMEEQEQRNHLDTAISTKYLFSLSMAIEGQKKVLRIDQLVLPNPIVETRKLIGELSTINW